MHYGYICEEHGAFGSQVWADWCYCPQCNQPARRDWRFHLDYSFESYYAPSFGTVVNSRSHAKDLAKIASEEATLRHGYDHDFQVIDTHDDAAVGIDTEQKKAEMENTRRFAVNGAAWSHERRAEINARKREVDEERKQKADA